MLPPAPSLCWASDSHLRVELGNDDSARTRGLVLAAAARLRKLAGSIEAVPGAATVMVTFDPMVLDHHAAAARVAAALEALKEADTDAAPPRVVELPVAYGGAAGPDLPEVARLCALTEQQVIERHAGAEHVVRHLGFAPGFAYIDGVPPELCVPRLDRPRTRVAPGSVAITGGQTGVYPRASPGGWRVIGRTSSVMFDPARAEPALLRAGDRVRFVPVPPESITQEPRGER